MTEFDAARCLILLRRLYNRLPIEDEFTSTDEKFLLSQVREFLAAHS